MNTEKDMSEGTVAWKVVLKNGSRPQLDNLSWLVELLGNSSNNISLKSCETSLLLHPLISGVFPPEKCWANQTKETARGDESDQEVAESLDLGVKLSLTQ